MKIVYEIERGHWSDFVYRHPNGNIFQTPEMYEVYKSTKNYEPILIAVVDDSDEIVGLLLSVIQRENKRLIGGLTARSIIWGGPLVKDNSKEILNLILGAYSEIAAKKAVLSQVRNLWSFSDNANIFSQNGYLYSEHLNFIIDLSIGKSKLFSNLSASKRRQIRKAREKIEISITEDESEVIEFYKILSSYYSQVVKKPVPPLEFFLLILKILVQNDLAKYFLVKSSDQIIGGIVCPISRNVSKQTLYELFICGSRAHNHLYPSVMATWAPLEWGVENGIDYFDFMGAGKPNVDYGVREFKAKFGGKLVNNGRFENIHNPLKYQAAKVGFGLWRKFL